jgi:hypothetical protein
MPFSIRIKYRGASHPKKNCLTHKTKKKNRWGRPVPHVYLRGLKGTSPQNDITSTTRGHRELSRGAGISEIARFGFEISNSARRPVQLYFISAPAAPASSVCAGSAVAQPKKLSVAQPTPAPSQAGDGSSAGRLQRNLCV